MILTLKVYLFNMYTASTTITKLVIVPLLFLVFCFNSTASAKTTFSIQERKPVQVISGAKTTLVIAATSDLHGWISTKHYFLKVNSGDLLLFLHHHSNDS